VAKLKYVYAEQFDLENMDFESLSKG